MLIDGNTANNNRGNGIFFSGNGFDASSFSFNQAHNNGGNGLRFILDPAMVGGDFVEFEDFARFIANDSRFNGGFGVESQVVVDFGTTIDFGNNFFGNTAGPTNDLIDPLGF